MSGDSYLAGRAGALLLCKMGLAKETPKKVFAGVGNMFPDIYFGYPVSLSHSQMVLLSNKNQWESASCLMIMFPFGWQDWDANRLFFNGLWVFTIRVLVGPLISCLLGFMELRGVNAIKAGLRDPRGSYFNISNCVSWVSFQTFSLLPGAPRDVGNVGCFFVSLGLLQTLHLPAFRAPSIPAPRGRARRSGSPPSRGKGSRGRLLSDGRGAERGSAWEVPWVPPRHPKPGWG